MGQNVSTENIHHRDYFCEFARALTRRIERQRNGSEKKSFSPSCVSGPPGGHDNRVSA